jgi:predicted N-acetyltransferase YhbS
MRVRLEGPADAPMIRAVNEAAFGTYDVPGDVFMRIELQPGSLQGVTGRVTYDEAFRQP